MTVARILRMAFGLVLALVLTIAAPPLDATAVVITGRWAL